MDMMVAVPLIVDTMVSRLLAMNVVVSMLEHTTTEEPAVMCQPS